MITIVTVTYNNLEGLDRTARSLSAQTAAAFEWVVIDGGSTDGTRQWLEQHPLVSRFVSEKDAGIYDAMRKGLNWAAGTYVLFLNAGDELDGTDAVLRVAEFVKDEDVYFFDTRMQAGQRTWIRRARPLESAEYSVPAVQQSTVYRTDSLRALEWPTRYSICGDYAIAAQLLARRVRSSTVNIVLSSFHLGGISTQSFSRLCVEAWDVQKTYLKIPAWLRLVGLLRRWTTGLGMLALYRLSARNGSAS